jgi:hypothetical protein
MFILSSTSGTTVFDLSSTLAQWGENFFAWDFLASPFRNGSLGALLGSFYNIPFLDVFFFFSALRVLAL